MTNSKGQDFERQISRTLSLWWTNGERDDIFWRNRVKITSKTPNAERQLGDITTVHTIGIPFVEVFNVELKAGYSKTRAKQAIKNNEERNKKRAEKGKAPVPLSVKNTPWDLLEIIDSKSTNLTIVKFWEQCKSDAELSGRIPLLIFKRDFHEPVACIDMKTKSLLMDYLGAYNDNYLYLTTENDHLYFFNLDKFLAWIPPEVIHQIHNSLMKNK